MGRVDALLFRRRMSADFDESHGHDAALDTLMLDESHGHDAAVDTLMFDESHGHDAALDTLMCVNVR
eukprot:1998790-Pyramimonas_sp.AAC.1